MFVVFEEFQVVIILDINTVQVSVKEKELMQKFFIAPKDTTPVKPQVVRELAVFLL